MSERDGETPEPVLRFAPERKARNRADPTGAGNALLAMLHEAAKLSQENCDSILAMAHRFSVELRVVEDRIKELEAEIEFNQDRAHRAEKWLERVHSEVEANLFVPLTAMRNEQSPNR